MHLGTRQLEQGIVGQQEPARPQHSLDVGQSETLLEHIVVDENVCRDKKIETLIGSQLGPLENDVGVFRSDSRRNVRAHSDRSDLQIAQPNGDVDRAGRRANTISKLRPIFNRLGLPLTLCVSWQLNRVRYPTTCVRGGPVKMVVHARAEVKSRDLQFVAARESQPHERIDDCEWLDGLLRIEIVSVLLVGEVKTRTNYSNSMNASRRKRALSL